MKDQERRRKLTSTVERTAALSESAGQLVPTGATSAGPVVAITQARMGSSRPPGKSMAEIERRPMLWHVIDRVERARMTDHVVMATSASAFGRHR